jgi:hypothetical protein
VTSRVVGADAHARVSFLRTYAFALITTLLIWTLVTFQGGWQDLITVVALTILEVTFSFDNAIVNSRLLKHLNPWWQGLFMTVGIFIAVFVVRFALPIFIVQLTTGLGFVETVNLAINDPTTYAHELHKAGPIIDSFGGTFLVMIGIAFLFDAEKELHWIGWLERRLAPLGRFDNLTTFVMLIAAIVLFFTVPEDGATRAIVLAGAICGIALHMGLDLLGAMLDNTDDEDDEAEADESDTPGVTAASVTKKVKVLVGAGAAVMFARLEVIDASFSFDGVIGAFALTSSVLIIMAGLGAGAVWVRAMTVHLLRAGTLAKFRYLEHGAMWAILFLGGVMIAKLYHVTPPEWATGSIGLVFIGISVVSSKIAQRRETKAETVTHTNHRSPVGALPSKGGSD